MPIPDEKEIPRQNFLCREVGFLIFDRVKNKFEANACYVKAGWRAEYEDRWVFEGNVNEFTAVVRWANFDEKNDTSYDLIIELITYITKSNKLLQVSHIAP